jgi:hypothetical protein
MIYLLHNKTQTTQMSNERKRSLDVPTCESSEIKKRLALIEAVSEYRKEQEKEFELQLNLKQARDYTKAAQDRVWERACDLESNIACITFYDHFKGYRVVADYVRLPPEQRVPDLRELFSGSKYSIENLWYVNNAWVDLELKDRFIFDEKGALKSVDFVLSFDECVEQYKLDYKKK